MILCCCLVGHGGCAILYGKSLSSSIICLCTNSNRLCTVRLQEISGSSDLFVCVYLPSESAMSCYSDYLNTLGKLEGFIELQRCDHTIVVGDFNVDFNRGGSLASLLTDINVEHNFVVCDLSYRESLKFTYERDDGLVNSWIDHVVCSQSLSLRVTDVHTVVSGTNLSDHLPLCFNLHISCTSISVPSSSVNSRTKSHIIWSKATPSFIMSYQDMVFKELLDPPLEFLECTKPACTTHTGLLNDYVNHMVSTLLDSAGCCFSSSAASPRKLAGWYDGAAKLKKQSAFWHNVWTEAGCPPAGVLSSIKKEAKKHFKYEVCCLKQRQQYHYCSPIARSFAQKRKNTFGLISRDLTVPELPQVLQLFMMCVVTPILPTCLLLSSVTR